MIRAVYTRTFAILKRIPVKLWGLSLLNGFLVSLIRLIGINLLFISIPVSAALEVGMLSIFYKTYSDGDVPDSKPMFAAFKDFQTFKHIAGGMCWMYLWLFLWALIPVAGPVFAIYKLIQYSFTPYILLEEKSVRALDALKKSKEDTKCYRGKIFLGVVLPVLVYVFVIMILAALSLIPKAGIVFLIIALVFTLAFSLFAPLFLGLVKAGYYEYCKKPAPALAPAVTGAPVTKAAEASANPAKTITSATITCHTCGNENAPDKKFCGHCGAKL